jgi:hypothetical protein
VVILDYKRNGDSRRRYAMVTLEQAAGAKKKYFELQEIFLQVKDLQYSVHYPDPLRNILDPLRAAAEQAAREAFIHQEEPLPAASQPGRERRLSVDTERRFRGVQGTTEALGTMIEREGRYVR